MSTSDSEGHEAAVQAGVVSDAITPSPPGKPSKNKKAVDYSAIHMAKTPPTAFLRQGYNPSTGVYDLEPESKIAPGESACFVFPPLMGAPY